MKFHQQGFEFLSGKETIFFCIDICIGMFPALNFSDKTMEMPSAVARMYRLVYHRDLIKQLLSKYLKLGKIEKKRAFWLF